MNRRRFWGLQHGGGLSMRRLNGMISAAGVFAATFGLGIPTHSLAGEVLDRIRSEGVIRTPVPDIWPPAVVLDENGDLSGFDVEAMHEIGRRLGVEVEYVRHPDGSIITFAEQVSGVWGDAYDIVVNSITPTEERAAVLAFPAVYYYSMAVLAVHENNTTIRVPADASGQRIGALAASTLEMYLQRRPFGIVGVPPFSFRIEDPEIVSFNHEEETFAALLKGDGVELDGLVNYLQQVLALIDEGAPLRVVGQPLFLDPAAVAIQPGDPEFSEALAKIVLDMRDDGTLRELSLKWFDYDFTEP
jgi:polar amino acid transport system substrate-binding protein